MPQWPWSVYSQRQTSVVTSTSGSLALDRADRRLHRRFGIVGRRADVVLVIGQAEQQHAVDAVGLGAAVASFDGLVDREVEDARHRRHFAPHAFALADEQRQHEHVRRQPRLAHERAHRRACGAAAAAASSVSAVDTRLMHVWIVMRLSRWFAVARSIRRSRRPAPESCTCAGTMVVCDVALRRRLGRHRPDRGDDRRAQQIGGRLGAEHARRSCAPPTGS